MSRFWSHTPYEEDQPYAKSILWVHVLTRAPPTAAVVGGSITGTAFALRKLNILSPKPTAVPSFLTTTLLRSVGVSTVWTAGILTIATVARMWGREDIEWKDRSWRLLENKGQVEVDEFMYVGSALGLLRGVGRKLPWQVRLGGVGVGSLAGVGVYMGWRYGVKGGKWDDDKVV